LIDWGEEEERRRRIFERNNTQTLIKLTIVNHSLLSLLCYLGYFLFEY
jgi:hypothetical protein